MSEQKSNQSVTPPTVRDLIEILKPFGGIHLKVSKGTVSLLKENVDGGQDVPMGCARVFLVEVIDDIIPSIFEVFWNSPMGVRMYPFIQDRVMSKFDNDFYIKTDDIRDCVGISGKILFTTRSQKRYACLGLSHLWVDSLPPFFEYAEIHHPEEAKRAFSIFKENLKKEKDYDTTIEELSLLWMIRVMREAVRSLKQTGIRHTFDVEELEVGEEEEDEGENEVLELCIVSNHDSVREDNDNLMKNKKRSRILSLKETIKSVLENEEDRVNFENVSHVEGVYIRPMLIEEETAIIQQVNNKYNMLKMEKSELISKELGELEKKKREETRHLCEEYTRKIEADESSTKKEELEKELEIEKRDLDIYYSDQFVAFTRELGESCRLLDLERKSEIEQSVDHEKMLKAVKKLNAEEFESFWKRKGRDFSCDNDFKKWMESAQSVATNLSISLHETKVSVFSQKEHLQHSERYKKRETDVGPRLRIMERRMNDHTKYLKDQIKKSEKNLEEKIDASEEKLTMKIENCEKKMTKKIKASEEKLTRRIEESEKNMELKIEASEEKLTRRIEESEKNMELKIEASEEKLTRRIEESEKNMELKIEASEEKLTRRIEESEKNMKEEIRIVRTSMDTMKTDLETKMDTMNSDLGTMKTDLKEVTKVVKKFNDLLEGRNIGSGRRMKKSVKYGLFVVGAIIVSIFIGYGMFVYFHQE